MEQQVQMADAQVVEEHVAEDQAAENQLVDSRRVEEQLAGLSVLAAEGWFHGQCSAEERLVVEQDGVECYDRDDRGNSGQALQMERERPLEKLNDEPFD